uniref:Uncharacterized protein n=1 Tax=Cannabis sativa TaxID=3483 RepID=A0A803QV29_CANSA
MLTFWPHSIDLNIMAAVACELPFGLKRQHSVFPWLNLIHEQSLPDSNLFVRSILGIEISAVVICRNSYTHLQY